MATSVAAFGKLLVAIDKGVSIPPEWALDKEGHPTTDPKAAAVLLPAGGPKGSGLAMMFECLSSVMAGNPLLAPILLGTGKVAPGTMNSAICAINIATFTDLEAYKVNIDNLIAGIKALPIAEGFKEVFVPGEPEQRNYAERKANGIPLPEGTVKSLSEVATKFGLTLPPSL
jgi:ureidoglycolate dehydrogenase (NAD+)